MDEKIKDAIEVLVKHAVPLSDKFTPEEKFMTGLCAESLLELMVGLDQDFEHGSDMLVLLLSTSLESVLNKQARQSKPDQAVQDQREEAVIKENNLKPFNGYTPDVIPRA